DINPAQSLLKQTWGAESPDPALQLMRIRKIICPTDLTPDSGAALRYGLALARAYEAQLIQLYCEPNAPTLVADASPPAPAELMREELTKHAGTDQVDDLAVQSVIVGCDDPGDCI